MLELLRWSGLQATQHLSRISSVTELRQIRVCRSLGGVDDEGGEGNVQQGRTCLPSILKGRWFHNMNDQLTFSEVIEVLKCSREQLVRWVANGYLAATRTEVGLRFDRKHVERRASQRAKAKT